MLRYDLINGLLPAKVQKSQEQIGLAGGKQLPLGGENVGKKERKKKNEMLVIASQAPPPQKENKRWVGSLAQDVIGSLACSFAIKTVIF